MAGGKLGAVGDPLVSKLVLDLSQHVGGFLGKHRQENK